MDASLKITNTTSNPADQHTSHHGYGFVQLDTIPDNDTINVAPRPDRQSKREENQVNVCPITFVDGHESLYSLPIELKIQLERHYNSTRGGLPPCAKTYQKTENLSMLQHFGRPCKFIVAATEEELDVARYSYNHRHQLTVVRGRQGSTFNDGKATFIVFSQKGQQFGEDEWRRFDWPQWRQNGIFVNGIVTRLMLKTDFVFEVQHDIPKIDWSRVTTIYLTVQNLDKSDITKSSNHRKNPYSSLCNITRRDHLGRSFILCINTRTKRKKYSERTSSADNILQGTQDDRISSDQPELKMESTIYRRNLNRATIVISDEEDNVEGNSHTGSQRDHPNLISKPAKSVNLRFLQLPSLNNTPPTEMPEGLTTSINRASNRTIERFPLLTPFSSTSAATTPLQHLQPQEGNEAIVTEPEVKLEGNPVIGEISFLFKRSVNDQNPRVKTMTDCRDASRLFAQARCAGLVQMDDLTLTVRIGEDIRTIMCDDEDDYAMIIDDIERRVVQGNVEIVIMAEQPVFKA